MIRASANDLILAYKKAIINEQEDIQKCLEHIIINELINSDDNYKYVSVPMTTPEANIDSIRKKDEMLREYMDENAKLREYLKMACRVIDAAVARGYNANDSEIERMHVELKKLDQLIDETGNAKDDFRMAYDTVSHTTKLSPCYTVNTVLL